MHQPDDTSTDRGEGIGGWLGNKADEATGSVERGVLPRSQARGVHRREISGESPCVCEQLQNIRAVVVCTTTKNEVEYAAEMYAAVAIHKVVCSCRKERVGDIQRGARCTGQVKHKARIDRDGAG